jgi:hypothetical protein
MAHRIRSEVGPMVFEMTKHEMKYPETRSTAENIELAALLRDPPGGYSAFNVPLLHSNFSSKLDIDTVFLNELLMQVIPFFLKKICIALSHQLLFV